VYPRVVYHDCSVQVFLVAAKSRVASLKAQTIPRLELCGALLPTDLAVPSESVYAWIDSAVVLGWLRTPSTKLKIFVLHRVADIMENISKTLEICPDLQQPSRYSVTRCASF